MFANFDLELLQEAAENNDDVRVGAAALLQLIRHSINTIEILEEGRPQRRAKMVIEDVLATISE